MSAALWHAAEIARATGGRAVGEWAVSGVSIDSRTVEPGDLFIALRGPKHDGHAFALDALKRGAALVVDHLPDGVPDTAPMIETADTTAALQALGAAARARSRARILAVTGSVGKTGTKEALRLALGAQAACHASAASHNNHWGVPLSLAREPRETAFAVYELGMNAPGEIAALSRLVRPHVTLITAIEAAHLGLFDSLDAIAEAKGEIFLGLEPDGTAILNADNPYFGRLQEIAAAAGCRRIVGFGASPSANARLLDARPDADGSDVVMALDGDEIAFRIGAPGRHWVTNALAVVAGAAALGADPQRAAAALAGFRAPAGRGRRIEIRWGGGVVTLIDESYNANPASMRAALELLRPAPGRRIAVLGDMLELGEHGGELHAGLAGPIAAAGVDRVFCAGPLMRHLHEALPAARRAHHAARAEELWPRLSEQLEAGDTVLVKGSLGARMGTIVSRLLEVDRSARERERAAGEV